MVTLTRLWKLDNNNMQIFIRPKPDHEPQKNFPRWCYETQEPPLQWMHLHFIHHFPSGSVVLWLLSKNKPRGWIRKAGKRGKETEFIQKLSNIPVRA